MILLAAWLLAASPAIPLDDLVKKVGENEVASEAAFKDRTCTMSIDAKELDKKGGVKDRSEITLSRKLVDGKPQDELVRYVENGKDVTEEKKKAQAGKDAKSGEAEDDGEEIRSPFHPENAASYAFEDLGADPADATLRRVRFQPKKGAASDELLIGDASISPDARLVSMRAKPAKLPPLVSTIDIAMAFGASGEIRKLEMSGEAGALFIKKRFQMVTTFDWP